MLIGLSPYLLGLFPYWAARTDRCSLLSLCLTVLQSYQKIRQGHGFRRLHRSKFMNLEQIVFYTLSFLPFYSLFLVLKFEFPSTFFRLFLRRGSFYVSRKHAYYQGFTLSTEYLLTVCSHLVRTTLESVHGVRPPCYARQKLV